MIDMIVKDKDGDLWEEKTPGLWECMTADDLFPRTFPEIVSNYGPVQIFTPGEH